MPKRSRDASSYSNAPFKKPRKYGSSLPAGVSKAGLVRAAKAYTPRPVPRSMIGFPATKQVTMRYVTSGLVTGAAGVLGKIDLRANGIFDPTVAAGGHQPLGYDQWEQFYNSYVVKSAKIKVIICNTQGAETTIPMAGILLHDGNAVPTNLGETMEQGKSTWKPLLPVIQSGGSINNLYGKRYDAAKFFNMRDTKDNLTRIGAAFGADPTDQAYWTLWIQAVDEASTVAATFMAIIEYVVELSEPKDLPGS